MIKNPRKLQHRLSTDISCMEAATFTNRIVEEKDAGRMRSLQGRGAGGWLETVPTSDKHALKQNEFRLASCLRLGVCLPFSQLLVKCECGAELDREGYHLITCKYGGGPVWTHNTLVSGWSECLSDLLICHQIEPRHRYIHTEDRPDITFYDVDSAVATELGGPWGHVPPQNALRYLRVRVTLTLTLTLRHRVSSVLGFLWPDKPLCPPTQQRLPSPMLRNNKRDRCCYGSSLEQRYHQGSVHDMWICSNKTRGKEGSKVSQRIITRWF